MTVLFVLFYYATSRQAAPCMLGQSYPHSALPVSWFEGEASHEHFALATWLNGSPFSALTQVASISLFSVLHDSVELRRPKQPWEASDGAIYLLRALAAVDPDAVANFLPRMAELGTVRHFDHANNLRETLWNCLPVLAASMGKKAFKPYLDPFLEAMFFDLKCDHPLCECAAGKCIAAFRDMLGTKIFAGRLDTVQLRELDQNQNIPAPAPAPALAARTSTPVKEGFAEALSRLGPGAQIPSLLSRKP